MAKAGLAVEIPVGRHPQETRNAFERHNVLLASIRYEAEDVISLDFRSVDAIQFDPFEPGAHIDICLPNGLTRSYSLTGATSDTSQYSISVLRVRRSNGGSGFIHRELKVGTVLQISRPRNNFPLDEQAPHSVFIAGGIGITPFLSMLRRLNALSRSWTLHYCVQKRSRAVFLPTIIGLCEAGYGELILNVDGEPPRTVLDIANVVTKEENGSHFYCCGPVGMIRDFRSVCTSLPQDQVHFEYFATEPPRPADQGFKVVLARSGRELFVAPGTTILEVLLAAGVNVDYSCQQGICGACETRVLGGEPDHHDLVLSDEEKASNRTMMVCCSGARSGYLKLDL
jgi:tetrachlorobenzoquinone reductase